MLPEILKHFIGVTHSIIFHENEILEDDQSSCKSGLDNTLYRRSVDSENFLRQNDPIVENIASTCPMKIQIDYTLIKHFKQPVSIDNSKELLNTCQYFQ